MRVFIFLMLVFVVFPFFGLILVNLAFEFAGVFVGSVVALFLIGLLVAFVDFCQVNFV